MSSEDKVIEALQSGEMSASQAVIATGLSMPTVKRILNALEAADRVRATQRRSGMKSRASFYKLL